MIFRSSRLLFLQCSKSLINNQVPSISKIIANKCSSHITWKYATTKVSSSQSTDTKNLDSENEINFDPEEFDSTQDFTDESIEKLCEGNPEKINRLKYLQLTISLLRQKGGQVPSIILETHWMRLLSYDTKNSQMNYLRSLHIREKTRNYAKSISKIEYEKYEKMKEAERERGPIKITTSGPIIYTLRYNSLFFRINNYAMDNFYNYRLLQAMMFGSEIVIDCEFESNSNERQIDLIAAQLVRMWAHNRDHVSPFHLIFCNLNLEGHLMKRLREEFKGINDPAYPFFYTSRCYSELFPKRKLVYLVSDTSNELHSFNSDDIYIIGAVANYNQKKILITAKAKKERLRIAKIPTRSYNLQIAPNQNPLSLFTILPILNDLKVTNNWKYSLRHLEKTDGVENDPSKICALDHSIKVKQRMQLTYDLLLKKSG